MMLLFLINHHQYLLDKYHQNQDLNQQYLPKDTSTFPSFLKRRSLSNAGAKVML